MRKGERERERWTGEGMDKKGIHLYDCRFLLTLSLGMQIMSLPFSCLQIEFLLFFFFLFILLLLLFFCFVFDVNMKDEEEEGEDESYRKFQESRNRWGHNISHDFSPSLIFFERRSSSHPHNQVSPLNLVLSEVIKYPVKKAEIHRLNHEERKEGRKRTMIERERGKREYFFFWEKGKRGKEKKNHIKHVPALPLASIQWTRW